MQQQMSLVTLGVADLARAKRFYGDGFGWKPVFETPQIVFYQMNGLILGLWLADKLAADMQRPAGPSNGFALAHNVATQADVDPLMRRLADHGGSILKAAVAPPHGGFAGYVADPDGHAWDIAWNPAWPIDAEGHITFGV